MAIDTEADDADITRCIDKIKKAWTHLGLVQPYFSVLTLPQFLPGNIASSITEFWQTGDREADELESIVRRYGYEELAEKICVEFGCGVGRVTVGLARRCATVHAYDLSNTHLAHAVRRARDTNVGNIVFHQCADNLLEMIHPCDLFYSRIVFQHNPPVIISRLIVNALKSLKPGGIALFQVPTYELGYRFRTAEWLAAEHPLDMQMHCLPQAKIFEIAGQESCAVLEVREDGWAGPSNVRISNSFVIRKGIRI
jgi:SAM-dependent methyltransferase